MQTKQMDFWSGDFGAQYTDRNTFSVEQLDEIYVNQYGKSRSDMNRSFISPIEPKNTLEVGCNVGNILRNLQHIDIQNLYGLELQNYAVEKARSICTGINIIQGSGFDIPFKDRFFDLVYTSGVLIHISPSELSLIMNEVYRVSNKYIWGFEYYSENVEHITYQGNEEKLWRGNYAELYMQKFPDLTLVKEEKFKYLSNGNVDQMFLLEKK